MRSLLLIEDESAIADTVIYALESEGFQVIWVTLGLEGVDILQADPDIALVILDVGLPDSNGFEICKAIRKFSDVPLIFLTARNDEIDRIVGLEIGADDYINKPFSPRELAVRVKVILKRMSPGSKSLDTTKSSFEINTQLAEISYFKKPLNLTRYEYLILQLLLKQPKRVFSRPQIMEQVWEMTGTSLERVVDTHIKSLRTKLREINIEDSQIKTHRGLGYSISS